QEGVVSSTAGCKLDADHSRPKTARYLVLGVLREVRIDRDVAPDTGRVLALQRQQLIVAVGEVRRRREIDRGRETPAAEDRGDVSRDADPLASTKPARVALPPVASRCPVVQ